MGFGSLVNYGKDGRMRIEGWFVYAALAAPNDQTVLVKFGISQVPMRRIYEVHCGSPYPIKRALWSDVGSRRNGRSFERAIAARLGEFKTRGEWFEFTMSDKRVFHSVSKAVYMRATGRILKWREVAMDDVIEFNTVDIKKWML